MTSIGRVGVRAILILGGMVCGLQASAAGPAPASADLSEIHARGTLRVLAVVVEDEPEFFSLKPGGAPGFDHEVLQAYCQLRKLKLEVVPVSSWDALVPALLGGKGDVIAGRFTVTESRKKRIEFTSEVFPTRNVAITRRPHRVIRTLEELKQEKIGIVKGTSLAEAVAAAGIPPSAVDDSIPAGGVPAALKSERITCSLDELAGAIVGQRRDADLQIGLFLGPPGSYAFGVRKDDPELLRNLSDFVDNLRRTPTWNRLVVKYFGENAPEILKKARGE
jgi:ABC-type amino acid transport substrate-binding protein